MESILKKIFFLIIIILISLPVFAFNNERFLLLDTNQAENIPLTVFRDPNNPINKNCRIVLTGPPAVIDSSVDIDASIDQTTNKLAPGGYSRVYTECKSGYKATLTEVLSVNSVTPTNTNSAYCGPSQQEPDQYNCYTPDDKARFIRMDVSLIEIVSLSTKLLLHMDENINDSSSYHHVFTSVSGDPVFSGIGKFGKSLNGSTVNDGRRIETTGNPFAGIGSGDFTLEFYATMEANTSPVQVIFSSNQTSIDSSSNPTVNAFFSGGSITFRVGMRDSNNIDTISYDLGSIQNIDNFHHYAIMRKNNVLNIYIDGHAGNPIPSNYSFFDGANYFKIGHDGNLNGGSVGTFAGKIDEFKISDTALYDTTGFVIP